MDLQNTGNIYLTFSEINLDQMLSGFMLTGKINLNGNAVMIGKSFD